MLDSLTAFIMSWAHNWHKVDAGLYRSGQSLFGHVGPLLRSRKIRTVINLRGANPNSSWYPNEKAACEKAGAKYIDLAINSRRLPSQEHLVKLADLFATEQKPILVKCSGGGDRTSLAAGIYLLMNGVPLEKARRQTRMIPYLHFPQRYQRWIKAFFEFYEADSNGQPIAKWLKENYTPERFGAHLEAQGKRSYWRPEGPYRRFLGIDL